MLPLSFTVPIQRAVFWAEEPILGVSPAGAAFLELTQGAPDVSFVDPLTRRRLGRLARAMIHCAAKVDPPEGHRMVFASRHGDCERSQGLMKEVAEGTPLSPAHFSVSVHNATVGLWSLLKGNRGPASSLAAGPDTFAMGLLEAAMAVEQAPEQAVLYVFGEEELPEVHHAFVKDLPTRHAVAFLVQAEAPWRLTFSLDTEHFQVGENTQLSLEMLKALAEGQSAIWCGPRGTWSLHAS